MIAQMDQHGASAYDDIASDDNLSSKTLRGYRDAYFEKGSLHPLWFCLR